MMVNTELAKKVAKRVYERIIEICNSDALYLERGRAIILDDREEFVEEISKVIFRALEGETPEEWDKVLNDILKEKDPNEILEKKLRQEAEDINNIRNA